MPLVLANRRVPVPKTGSVRGTGWLAPSVDRRDYTERHPALAKVRGRLEERLKANKRALGDAPGQTDLRPWCSPIEDQGTLGSCTAHAAMGVVEYYQRRAVGRHLDGSRLFVYKTTRNLMGVTGDTGAWLRNAMGAIATCGVPDERYWPYTDQDPAFDQEPSQFVYAIADGFEALSYFAHDPLGVNVAKDKVVESVKKYLAAGVPSMFGFWGFASFDHSDAPGHIPLPTAAELAGDPAWGHAIDAMGYDDAKRITNTLSNETTMGAFLIRNSWGAGWGDGGYGWIPYEYVLKGVALDFWSLLKAEWVDTDQFYF